MKELYLEGRYRAAYTHGAAFGPLRAWDGPAGRLIAGRLAMQLGAQRLGKQLHALVYRESPAYPEAVYYSARYRLDHFGPYSCWCFCRVHTDWAEASPEVRGDWAALQGYLAARFRDFDRAEKFLAQSEQVAPNRPWHHVERSSIAELQDNLPEALAAARRSLEIQPMFRPAVQAIAHVLVRQGQDSQALELLEEAAARLESSLVLAQLAGVQLDLGMFEESLATLDRFEEFCPLLDADTGHWLAARRADLLYRVGRYTACVQQAKLVEAKDKFYPGFGERVAALLECGSVPQRVEHPVPAGNDGPTPPSAFDLLAKHLHCELPPLPAKPMADGLPDAIQRKRLTDAGWGVRAFTLNFADAAEVFRRGGQVLASLFGTGVGQVRLFTGFDATRQTLFVLEQGERRIAEAPQHLLEERFRSTGPHALAVLPPGTTDVLAELPLRDAALHDLLHELQLVLAAWQFGTAEAVLAKLHAAAPGHLLAKLGQLAWAKATNHPVRLLDAAEELLAIAPTDVGYQLLKSNALRELGRMPERVEFLRQSSEVPTADAVLLQSYAQTVLSHPVLHADAEQLLRHSIRLRPHAPAGYYLLSAHTWEHQQFAHSVELHRMACCLDDREEQFAEGYIRVARVTKQLPEAMRLLQRRSTTADEPTPAAVRAHVLALIERGEPEYAWSALEKGVEKLAPAPGEPPGEAYIELQYFHAQMLGNACKFAEAEAVLGPLQPHAPPAEWFMRAAKLARAKPAYREALGRARAWHTLEPHNLEATRTVAGLLTDVEGRPAAKAFLLACCAKSPQDYAVQRLRAEYLTGEGESSEAIAATQRLLKLCPTDAWAERQLALLNAEAWNHADALAAIERSGRHEPKGPSYYAIRANALRKADRTEEAVDCFKDGLAANVDHELSIVELVRTARGSKEKRAALRFIYDQLQHQPTNGDGLMTWRDQRLQHMDEPEDEERVYVELEYFLDERPDLWQSWSVMVQQLAMMQRTDEAYTLARDATARFPLLARLWIDLAEVCRVTNRTEERAEALRQAMQTAPGWTQVARALADDLAEQGDYEEATNILEQNLARAPADPVACGFLADRLWDSDESEAALRYISRAIRLEPGYDWAWQAMSGWGERLDNPNAVIDLSRELVRDRGGDARVHMKLARSLYRYEQTDEALVALDRAIAIDPKNPEAYDLKAERLCEVGRYDEALEAANPPALIDDSPIILRGRAAWVEARRDNYGRAIPMMQALVAVDPGYYWGWSQLAEWYNDIGKSEAYLEAANELIRLRPDHPTPLTMRGEAKIQTDDRDGGKADLREALRLHPGYSPAAAILFDACLEDGELREARGALSVLQEHMTGQEVLLKQLTYANRTEDTEAAIRAFTELCEAEGEGPPTSMQLAMVEMRKAELDERALTILHEAWHREEPFNPWAALFWMDTVPEKDATPAERLAAVDAAVKHYPEFIPAYDRKAEHLARQGEREAARAVCFGYPGTPIPLTLRGRAAWIEGLSGKYDTAITEMKKCLEEDPDYTWGWRQLAHWYDDTQAHADYLTAAENLVRLAPRDPYSYGIRGEAKRLLGDHRGARNDYQRAYEIDPDFEAAGHQLLSEQINTDDLDGAANTLKQMKQKADSPLLGLRSVQLFSKRNEAADAQQALRELGTNPNVARATLRDAAAAFDERGWGEEANALLAELLAQPDVSPMAAAVWVERHVTTGQGWKVADRLAELVESNPEVGREAVLVYTWALAVTEESALATATIQRYSGVLMNPDTVAWARAGMTLGEAKSHDLALAWLSDYARRTEVEPWMLRSLADAHRHRGELEQSFAVLRAAEELNDDDTDDFPEDFIAWLGLEAALTGDWDTATDHSDALIDRELNATTMVLAALLRVLVTAHTKGEEPGALKQAKKRIAEAWALCPKGERPVGLAKYYPRLVACLVATLGTFRAKLWGFFQRFGPIVVE